MLDPDIDIVPSGPSGFQVFVQNELLPKAKIAVATSRDGARQRDRRHAIEGAGRPRLGDMTYNAFVDETDDALRQRLTRVLVSGE